MDAADNVYITGQFSGTTDFDPSPTSIDPLTARGPTDAFVLKLDSTGNFIWARQFGGSTSSTSGQAIEVDAAGDVYTTGLFSGTADFDSAALGAYRLTNLGQLCVHRQTGQQRESCLGSCPDGSVVVRLWTQPWPGLCRGRLHDRHLCRNDRLRPGLWVFLRPDLCGQWLDLCLEIGLKRELSLGRCLWRLGNFFPGLEPGRGRERFSVCDQPVRWHRFLRRDPLPQYRGNSGHCGREAGAGGNVIWATALGGSSSGPYPLYAYTIAVDGAATSMSAASSRTQ